MSNLSSNRVKFIAGKPVTCAFVLTHQRRSDESDTGMAEHLFETVPFVVWSARTVSPARAWPLRSNTPKAISR